MSSLAPLEPRAFGTLVELIAAFDATGDRASDQLARAFRDPALGDAERGRIARCFYDAVRDRRRLALALGEGAAPRSIALAEELWRGAITAGEARRRDPLVDWARVEAIDAVIAAEADPLRRFAIAHALPDFLAERLLREHGDDAAPLARALGDEPPQTLRANPLLGSREEVIEALRSEGVEVAPARHARLALTVTNKTNVFRTDAFRRGRFEVQDEGSQLIAELVAPPPGGSIVDACAGAGGKTLALAALSGGKGSIHALDVSAEKIAELRRRARRARASNIRALSIDPSGPYPAPIEALEGRIDRLLVDAPCSGVGVLRRNPEARWRLTPEALARLPELQRAILERALPLLAPGGRLIYATCTVLDAENEAVIRAVLAEHPELERVFIAEIYGRAWSAPLARADGLAMVLFPHRHGTDGFFATVLRRRRVG